MAKNARAEEAENDEGGAAAPEAKKRGLIGRLLSPLAIVGKLLGYVNPFRYLKLSPKLQMIAGGVLLLLALGGGGAWYFLGGHEAETTAEGKAAEPVQITHLPTENTSFYEIPDIIVNIQAPDGSPAYLKLAVALEIDQPDAKALIEPVLPRVIDQFQTYLRELRVEDIRGSAGVMRLKEELLRRVNFALAPLPVRDVLLKEMIVQ
jgi:flagellar FliL protein